MKFFKTMAMVPILIGLNNGGTVASNTNIAYNEKDILNNFVNVDREVFNLSKCRDNIIYDKELMNVRFNHYLKKWQSDILFTSDINEVIENKNFQSIIALGDDVVPFIINELKYQPSYLVWSLNIILHKRISRNNITIAEASKVWIKWWEQTNKYNV